LHGRRPCHVAEAFTGTPGKYVALKDTIRGFKAILAGEHDALPEQAFYMVGGGALEIQPHMITILADTAAQLRAIEKLRQLRKGG